MYAPDRTALSEALSEGWAPFDDVPLETPGNGSRFVAIHMTPPGGAASRRPVAAPMACTDALARAWYCPNGSMQGRRTKGEVASRLISGRLGVLTSNAAQPLRATAAASRPALYHTRYSM
jgi:hypothetical protein